MTFRASQSIHRFPASFLVALSLLFIIPSALHAQQTAANTGTINGVVVDKTTGQPLASVAVEVVGLTGVGASTNEAGKFTIARIPAGTVTLQFRRIGFTPKTVTGIFLNEGKSLTVDVTLETFAVLLSASVVTAAEERGSVREALATQRSSTNVVNSVTAEQIAKSPDSDAANAVQRIPGLTVQGGAAVARGQAGSATIANLNNVRIPSPEPEKKQVPFDMFPSSLIRSIDVIKTFTPDQPGDFSGAVVNIQTREFPARKTVSYSTSIGMNDRAFGNEIIASPMQGAEWLAIASGNRKLPSIVREAGNFGGRQYSQSEINQMIGSFRNSWSPERRNGAPNSSFGMSFGGNDPVLGRQLGYIASLTYSTGTEVRDDEVRSQIDFGTGNTPANTFTGTTGRTSVLWGGIVNLSTFVGDGSLITMNNMYNRTSDSEAHQDRGTDENYGVENILERTTLSFVERSVRSNQIAGQHTLSERDKFDWSLTNSAVSRREPDRSDMVYIAPLDQTNGQQLPFELFTASSDGARRTFADLTEGSWNMSANFERELGDEYVPRTFKLGTLLRHTSRNAEVFQYSMATLLPLAPDDARLSAEEIFDGRFTTGSQSVFTINPLSQSGSYRASDLLAAGYAMVEYGLGERMKLVGGARVENSNVEVATTNLFGGEEVVNRNFLDVLPSLALNISVGENHQIRFSAGRTLARPEYRELSPILNRDVLGGQGFQGDTSLVRTLISNFDARWEWYPNPGELISIALFAKYHDRPIEKVEVPTSGTSVLSFINAEGAENFGVEVEVRKELGNMIYALQPFTVFGNLTLMSSEVRLGTSSSASATNPNRALAGQAPYVINAGLTYAPGDGEFNATALYNRVGRRINAAGPLPLPDIYEMGRDVVDLAVRFPVFGGFGAKFDFKNILDTPVEHRQGAVTRLRYNTGRVMTFGVNWKP